MIKVTEQSVCNNCQSLKFDFSNTKRGENINISSLPGDYIIDVDGNIFRRRNAQGMATITIIGGIDEHAYKKDNIEGEPFYMNNKQIKTMRKIIGWFAKLHKFDGKMIPGNNQELNSIAEGIFHNQIS